MIKEAVQNKLSQTQPYTLFKPRSSTRFSVSNLKLVCYYFFFFFFLLGNCLLRGIEPR